MVHVLLQKQRMADLAVMYSLHQRASMKLGGGNGTVNSPRHTFKSAIRPCTVPWIKQSKSMKMIVELSLLCVLCPPDLISQLIDPVVDPWLDRETCYNLIPVPESYTGPRLSFPLSVSDTNALLSAFKEQQV